MTRTARYVVFGVGTAAMVILGVVAVLGLPAFGGSFHPYRDAVIRAAVAHGTSNAISSVNFDLRGLDTLGEETIFLASVVVIAVVLRPASDETEERKMRPGRPLDSTVFGGLLILPVTVIIGLDVVTHGHLTPGGGFQGGVLLAGALLLVYVAGQAVVFKRLGPMELIEVADAAGAAAYGLVAVGGLVFSVAAMANFLALGTSGHLLSGGTILVLQGAVGLEVTGAVVLILTELLDQTLLRGA